MIAFNSPKFRDRTQLNVKIPAFWDLYVAVLLVYRCLHSLLKETITVLSVDLGYDSADLQPNKLLSVLRLCSYLTCSGLPNQRYQTQRLAVMAQIHDSCFCNGTESWDCHIWVSWSMMKLRTEGWLFSCPNFCITCQNMVSLMIYFIYVLQIFYFYWCHEPAMIQPFFSVIEQKLFSKNQHEWETYSLLLNPVNLPLLSIHEWIKAGLNISFCAGSFQALWTFIHC